jgi:hypothetical protein
MLTVTNLCYLATAVTIGILLGVVILRREPTQE